MNHICVFVIIILMQVVICVFIILIHLQVVMLFAEYFLIFYECLDMDVF